MCVACSGSSRKFNMNDLSSKWRGRDPPEEVTKVPVNPEKECGLHPWKDFKKQSENFLCLCFGVHPAHGATVYKLKWMGHIRATRSTSPKLSADGKRTRCQLEEAPTIQRWDTWNIRKNRCKVLKHIKHVKNTWVHNDYNNSTSCFWRMLENQCTILKRIEHLSSFFKTHTGTK